MWRTSRKGFLVKYLMVHLVKENWREYISKNNPVAAALLSKMNYTEEEKVRIKIEFARMMANMQLDLAKSTILTTFFETYLQLNREQEEEYKRQLSVALKPEEVEQFVQLTTSYHEEGRKEGKEEGKEIGLEMTLTALEAFREGKNLDEVMILTGLERDKLLKIQAHAFK
jgi:flagellar biosynthesis/type III secretory pathway protein FliH